MRPNRRRDAGLLVLMAATVLLGALTGCGGTTSSSGATSSSSTPVSVVVEPPTIPPADPAVCALLAETVGLDNLVPIDSSSWRDERERIVVDAQREATLLRRAAAAAPVEIRTALENGATYADVVSEAVGGASDFDAAMVRLGEFGDEGDLSAVQDQAASVAAWRAASC